MTNHRKKFKDETNRLKNWDYGSNAAYFVTICTADRNHFFGEIKNTKMYLSDIGQVANQYWSEIPDHFPFVKLDAFVIMPDHIHGIIIIDKQIHPNDSVIQPNKFGPQSQNLGSIVRGFKTGVTKYARMNDIEFKWQSRYHDHIIRNEKSFYRIRKYIIDNPKNW
ncbi:transposase [Salibacter sp.]|uniref:transposase n=1 Tax=Salibacter sp. TaxID=2010995 RepID=UPI002870411E|nr:transposase [Salibacter sp.]MDR9399065.1 transposase [Salibacter sp.]MDR9488385.1 transposase [Salibacter sp.]